MSLNGSGYIMKYKPGGVGRINYISAIGDNVILISQGVGCCRILEYNMKTKQVIERVTDVGYPGKVNVVPDGHHTKHIHVVKWYNPWLGES